MKADSGPSVRRHMAGFLLLAAATMASTGCTAFQGIGNYLAYSDSCNDFVLGYRNMVWARQAWRSRKYQFCDQPQFYAFGEGFRDGYQDVASGGTGCVPALPPRKFWGWKYQTAEGQAKVAAWFAGFPYGASAAAEEGAGNWQEIQVSHLIEMQYSPEFQRGECPPQHEHLHGHPDGHPSGAIGTEIINEQPIQGPLEPNVGASLPVVAPDMNSESRRAPIQQWPSADLAYAVRGRAP